MHESIHGQSLSGAKPPMSRSGSKNYTYKLDFNVHTPVIKWKQRKNNQSQVLGVELESEFASKVGLRLQE